MVKKCGFFQRQVIDCDDYVQSLLDNSQKNSHQHAHVVSIVMSPQKNSHFSLSVTVTVRFFWENNTGVYENRAYM